MCKGSGRNSLLLINHIKHFMSIITIKWSDNIKYVGYFCAYLNIWDTVAMAEGIAKHLYLARTSHIYKLHTQNRFSPYPPVMEGTVSYQEMGVVFFHLRIPFILFYCVLIWLFVWTACSPPFFNSTKQVSYPIHVIWGSEAHLASSPHTRNYDSQRETNFRVV